MGSTKIRRFLKNDSKWTDKETVRHEHDFCEEGVAYIHVAGAGLRQFHIMKCKFCNSFHTIPVDGNTKGVVPRSDNLVKLYFISRSKLMNIDKNMKCVDWQIFQKERLVK